PNLIGDQYALILAAGIDDWGGVSPLTPDHVNPERPWPQIEELTRRTEAAGLRLAERLTIYPGYLREPWLDPPLAAHVAALADALRRDVNGDDITYVVTRNINFTNVCYTGCRFCAFAQRRTDADAYTLSLSQVGDRAEEAWQAGATEVCMQGGIHPDLPGTAY